MIQARGPYRKAEDAGLLLPIRAIIDERPTYGYRRVWALFKRHLRSAGKPTVNMKRVLRMIQNHGLTLERHTARRPDRAHDGVIIALHSNIRWCSGRLRAARQESRDRPDPVRARCLRPRDHRLVGRGERRYLRRDGTRSHDRRRRAPVQTHMHAKPVDWLSDNGSAYIAKDTADIARALA